jgi:hypothetical protein
MSSGTGGKKNRGGAEDAERRGERKRGPAVPPVERHGRKSNACLLVPLSARLCVSAVDLARCPSLDAARRQRFDSLAQLPNAFS